MRPHKTALTFPAFVVLVGWLVSTGSAQTNAQPARAVEQTRGFSDAGRAALSSQLSSAVTRGDTPGVVALVVCRDGVLYEGAAGKLDVAKNIAMPVNAIFSIASMTKPVTSVAIMMLLEEGKLKLDDPVSKYLTGFDNLRVITKFNEKDATYETRPAKRPMTIRHLLTHTSVSDTGLRTRSSTGSRRRRRRASGNCRSSAILATNGTTAPARACSE